MTSFFMVLQDKKQQWSKTDQDYVELGQLGAAVPSCRISMSISISIIPAHLLINCIIRAYWEFKLQQAGIWSVGLANPGCDLNRNLGTDLNSWCLTQDNVIMFNGDIEHKLEPKIQEGDVIVSLQMINYPCSLTNQFHHQGFTYDHVELNVYLNGENLNCPLFGIKGTVYPVFYGKNDQLVVNQYQ